MFKEKIYSCANEIVIKTKLFRKFLGNRGIKGYVIDFIKKLQNYDKFGKMC